MEQKIRTLIEKLGFWILLAIAGAIAAFSLSGCSMYQEPARVVRVTPSINRSGRVLTKPATLDLTKEKIASKNQNKNANGWIWPTQGTVISNFKTSKKGIDIAGRDGAAVLAVSDGEVVYSGDALRGYGNLIIIKHDKNYLSAYGHNRRNFVKEGEKVRKGQRIAEVGKTGTDSVKLHFEVRNQGKPIDPLTVLPRR